MPLLGIAVLAWGAALAKPNFVVIVGEGHGWSSTSVAMDDARKTAREAISLTPNLAKLSSDGMRMSAFYASCPRCTPSRASFFTGISPTKLHMTYVNEGGKEKRGQRGNDVDSATTAVSTKLIPPSPTTEIPPGTRTIADVLHSAGYATAHFGKWHVGRKDPTEHGFDLSDGPNTNSGPGRNRTPNPTEGKLITDRGIKFIEDQVKVGRPFYLHIDHYGGGTQEEVTAESWAAASKMDPDAKDKRIAELGVMRDVDVQVGRLLDRLAQLKIADNTYVIYTADHGTPGFEGNPPLARGKGSVQEGGIRVPLIVRGPGVKAGSSTSTRAIGWDLAPTFADLAGAKAPKEMEGGSLASVWRTSGGVTRPRVEIVVHFPHYDLDNGGPASAIFLGKYKLIRSYESGQSLLFDVAADIAESKDLAKSMPDQVARMEKALDEYLKSVDAQMAKPNPDYKPGSEPAPKRKGGKGGKGKKGVGG